MSSSLSQLSTNENRKEKEKLLRYFLGLRLPQLPLPLHLIPVHLHVSSYRTTAVERMIRLSAGRPGKAARSGEERERRRRRRRLDDYIAE